MSLSDKSRKEIFQEVVATHPETSKEKIARIFTAIPYVDDIDNSRLRNGVIVLVLALSCFSNYAGPNQGFDFGFWLVCIKLLCLYFLLKPSPYIYLFLLAAQIVSLGLVSFGLFELIKFRSAYAYYGMDKYQNVLILTIGKFVANAAFAMLIWNVYRFRFPNYRLLKQGLDEEGNLLV